ncbi:MAG: hypothetical protein K5669_10680 [Lachnospiraceae bacterium]|nr:hypothetical protein [Lachnospiraceae bacterium]
MACFLISTAEAVVTTVAAKQIEKNENLREVNVSEVKYSHKTPFSKKLKWLRNMLWGGSALLLFEHVWHGEIVPFFPFLTAASNPADAAEMLHEMATVGVTMALLVTGVWGVIVGITTAMEKKAEKEDAAQIAEHAEN